MAKENPSVEQVLNSFGNVLTEALRTSLVAVGGGSEELKNSIGFQLELKGEVYSFQLNLADYYYWVDHGRAAGKAPPIQPAVIGNWIKARGIKFQPKTLPKRHRKNYNTSRAEEKAQKSLAFLIGRKIARQGTKGNNFYSRVMTPELIDRLKNDLQQAFRNDVDLKVKELINDRE